MIWKRVGVVVQGDWGEPVSEARVRFLLNREEQGIF